MCGRCAIIVIEDSSNYLEQGLRSSIRTRPLGSPLGFEWGFLGGCSGTHRWESEERDVFEGVLRRVAGDGVSSH